MQENGIIKMVLCKIHFPDAILAMEFISHLFSELPETPLSARLAVQIMRATNSQFWKLTICDVTKRVNTSPVFMSSQVFG